MNQYNIINVNVSFDKLLAVIAGCQLAPRLVSGDYNSTKMVFTFDRDYGTKVLEIKNKNSDDIVFVGEIENGEVTLCGEDNGEFYSIFNEAGDYICEVSLYGDNSKLTCMSFTLPVAQEQIVIGENIVEPYIPLFDELMNEINRVIAETENVDIDANKAGNVATISITNRNGETKDVQVYDGQDGAKGDKGDQGIQGPAGQDGKDGKDGKDGINGLDGQDGADGFSPIANVSQSGDITTISITDKNGTTTESIDLSNKQNTLISGINIKTINDTSLLGSGNITIGGSDIAIDDDTITTNSNDEIQTVGIKDAGGNTCKFWNGTLQEYNAIQNKDSNTFYNIIDDYQSNGVIAGGTTGQVLAKASNANYDLEWISQHNFTHETWTFTLSDDSTVDKEIVLW